MVTYTSTYNLKLPVVGQDDDAWGGYINDNTNALENLLTGSTTITNLVITTASVTGDFTVDTNTLHVDATNNRVGIGTTTVDTKLHLEESDTTSVFLKTQNSAGALLLGNNSAGNSFVSSQTSGKPLLFETANTERMRIDDSSGSLLVGRTTTSDTNVGGMIRPDGFIQSTRDGNIAADFNRNTSDGELVRFSKGSSPKGAIGVSADGPAFGTTTQQVAFHADKLFPCQSYGSALDATIDLGYSGSRFKDIWLSSAVKSSGDLTVDVGGDIILDADGGDIKISDGGTHVGSLRNVSSDFVIQSIISDQNIIFKGNDGGSEINALSLDMSENGVANFAAGANFEGDIGINAATNARLTINDNVGEVGSGNLAFQASNTAGSALKPMGFRAEDIRFATGSAERVRITDDGILVGKTSSNSDTVGIELSSSNLLRVARSGGATAYLNRKTNNGDIITLAKDGTTVGSIGIQTGGLTIDGEANHTGLMFAGASVLPRDNAALTDGTTDLGTSDGRWKDLHLSGDIYMGYRLYHDGDTDTYIQFDNNVVYLVAGGSSSFIAASSYSSTYVPMYNYAAYFEETASLSGTSPTINAAASGVFYLTMSGNTSFTFTGTSSNWGVGFVLYLTGNGGTVTWPSSVDWAGGTAPDAPASGETDVYVFHTRDGSNWVGVLSADAAS